MAKKPKNSGQGGKDVTKCVKMVKNPETGGYFFKEEMVSNDKVDQFFKEKEEKKEAEQEQ